MKAEYWYIPKGFTQTRLGPAAGKTQGTRRLTDRVDDSKYLRRHPRPTDRPTDGRTDAHRRSLRHTVCIISLHLLERSNQCLIFKNRK